MKRFIALLIGVVTYTSGSVTRAESFEIAVQPVLPEYQMQQAYQPLADYLSAKTGHDFRIRTYKNFLTYWERMKKQKGFDFVLDAAHFTDWRIKKQDFTVLARLPDTVSFSLVTHEDNFVFDAEELVMKKVATMASPGMGAIRLNNMFPNPVRLPLYVQSSDSADAAKRVVSGKADAAIIPTPLVSSFEGLNMVETTDPVPHMGFSVSPGVDPAIVEKVRLALIEAISTEDGKQMLSELKIEQFQTASNDMYDGYGELLQDVFGY